MWNPIPMQFRPAAIIGAAVVIVVFTVSWKINDWRWQSRWSDREAAYATEKLAAVNEATAKLQKQIDDNQIIAREFEHELERTESALAVALTDNRKLRICTASRPRVPTTPAAGSGSDAAAAGTGLPERDQERTGTVLDPQFLYEIGGQANILSGQVRGLQRYVTEVCLR